MKLSEIPEEQLIEATKLIYEFISKVEPLHPGAILFIEKMLLTLIERR